MGFNITINKKKVTVPKFNELTVKQYKELLPFVSAGNGLDIVRYLSITTDQDYEKALHFEFKNIDRFNTMLGEFKFVAGDTEKIKDINYIESGKPQLLFTFERNIYDLRKFKPKAVGYRILLEQYMKSKPNYMELYQFMCAAVITEGFDYDETIETMEALEDYNAFKVFAIGAFFFRRWKRKELGGSMRFNLLKRVLSTSMLLKNPKLVLIDSKSIIT